MAYVDTSLESVETNEPKSGMECPIRFAIITEQDKMHIREKVTENTEKLLVLVVKLNESIRRFPLGKCEV